MADKHTAFYVRVSTVGQDHASQMPDLEKWKRANDGAAVWYHDKFTGKTMDRPGMTKLMDAINAGKVERVVCWRLDRLGRTARGLCELFDTLQARRVDLVSLRDGFSLESPAGRLHARILASVAEYETEVRAERVRAGQAVARAKGKRWGGSTKGRLLKVKPDQLRLVLDLVANGGKNRQGCSCGRPEQADHLSAVGEPRRDTQSVFGLIAECVSTSFLSVRRSVVPLRTLQGPQTPRTLSKAGATLLGTRRRQFDKPLFLQCPPYLIRQG